MRDAELANVRLEWAVISREYSDDAGIEYAASEEEARRIADFRYQGVDHYIAWSRVVSTDWMDVQQQRPGSDRAVA